MKPESISQQVHYLLQQFNSIDQVRQGSIQLKHALHLITHHTSIPFTKQYIQTQILSDYQYSVTFHDLLSIMHDIQFETGLTRSIINHRAVQFIRLLKQYLQKCEQTRMYAEAERCHQRLQQIKRKEMRKSEEHLATFQRNKTKKIQQIHSTKLNEFKKAWDQYMSDYEQMSLYSIENLKSKHINELQNEQMRIRNHYERYQRPSIKIKNMKSQEQQLVKEKSYLQAEKLKRFIDILEQKQRERKNREIELHIQKRKQALQKQQEHVLMAHLQKLRDRREHQIKIRERDSEKILARLTSIENDAIQKQNHQISVMINKIGSTINYGKKYKKNKELCRIDNSRKRMKSLGSQPMDPRRETSMGEEKHRSPIRINTIHRSILD